MTDTEVICTWMDGPKPEPTNERSEHYHDSGWTSGDGYNGWWEFRWSVANQQYSPHPNSDKVYSLDALHEVEARLTEGQRREYGLQVELAGDKTEHWTWRTLHATAEQKIKALAAVLRPIVEVK